MLYPVVADLYVSKQLYINKMEIWFIGCQRIIDLVTGITILLLWG